MLIFKKRVDKIIWRIYNSIVNSNGAPNGQFVVPFFVLSA